MPIPKLRISGQDSYEYQRRHKQPKCGAAAVKPHARPAPGLGSLQYYVPKNVELLGTPYTLAQKCSRATLAMSNRIFHMSNIGDATDGALACHHAVSRRSVDEETLLPCRPNRRQISRHRVERLRYGGQASELMEESRQ